MDNRDITIYDIAQEAGVSPSTVSRVLTKNAGVSQAKREAVERLIKKYGFRPNAMARSLSDTQSKVLGVIVADIRNPYYAELVVECEKAANRQGYSVMVCNALSMRELEASNLEKLYEQRVDAIIQIGCAVDDLVSDPAYTAHVNRISRTIPFIITGKLDGADCYRLNIDDAAAMEIAVDHLISMGHKRIAFGGGARDVRSTYEKIQHYIYLLGRNGLAFRKDYIQESTYNYGGGQDSIERLLALDQPPTAVIMVNDFSAVGAIHKLTERGISVPGDMSVISFDNTYLCHITNPLLTSIDYDYPLFGEKLVAIALDAVQEKKVKTLQKIIPRLIIRDSSGPAPTT